MSFYTAADREVSFICVLASNPLFWRDLVLLHCVHWFTQHPLAWFLVYCILLFPLASRDVTQIKIMSWRKVRGLPKLLEFMCEPLTSWWRWRKKSRDYQSLRFILWGTWMPVLNHLVTVEIFYKIRETCDLQESLDERCHWKGFILWEPWMFVQIWWSSVRLVVEIVQSRPKLVDQPADRRYHSHWKKWGWNWVWQANAWHDKTCMFLTGSLEET